MDCDAYQLDDAFVVVPEAVLQDEQLLMQMSDAGVDVNVGGRR